MKRLTIVLGALGALILFSVYCAKVEFDNVIDPQNSRKFLVDSLKLCANDFPLIVPGDRTYGDCGELMEVALQEDSTGVANILNESHPINKLFNEDRTPPRVVVFEDLQVTVTTAQGQVAAYRRWMGNGGFPGVRFEPEGDARVVPQPAVLTNTSGDVLPQYTLHSDMPGVGHYIIIYSATKTLNSGEVLRDQATRTLIVREPDISDTLTPVITLRGERSMSIQVGDRFSDPGATARTPANTVLNDNIVRTLGAGHNDVLLINGSDTTIKATGQFNITYTVCNPNKMTACTTQTRTVVGIPGHNPIVPTPVIVLTRTVSVPYELNSADVVLRMGGTFTEPGFRAFYRKDGVEVDITNRVVPGPLPNTAEHGLKTRSYSVAAVANEHEATSVNRNIWVFDHLCGDGNPAPTNSGTWTNPIEIEAGRVWTYANSVQGWTARGNDELGGTFRLVDYGTLNPQNPVAGTYTIRGRSIGECGGPSAIIERTVTVR